LLALRFANADLLPLDYSIYATEVAAYLEGLEKIAPADFFTGTIRPLIEECRAWHDATAKITAGLEAWRAGAPVVAPGTSLDAIGERRPAVGTPPLQTAVTDAGSAGLTCPGGVGKPAAAHAINTALMAQERAWLDEQGIPGRPWFRHLVYAPLASYEAETLPGLREALEAGDLERARQQAERLRAALQRARGALSELLQTEN
jgi:N-acetylated-alpha-linked acidic dipeptidase